jgi:hypothetical protein
MIHHDFDDELADFYYSDRPDCDAGAGREIDQIVRQMIGSTTHTPRVASATLSPADVTPAAFTDAEVVQQLIDTIVPDLPIFGPAPLRGRLLMFRKR